MFILREKASAGGGQGVGVMKDKELKLQEVEAPYTLGGAGEGACPGRGKSIGAIVRFPKVNRSRRSSQQGVLLPLPVQKQVSKLVGQEASHAP